MVSKVFICAIVPDNDTILIMLIVLKYNSLENDNKVSAFQNHIFFQEISCSLLISIEAIACNEVYKIITV